MNAIAARYTGALIQAVVLQFLWLLLAVMVKDMGQFLEAVAYSSIAFWTGVLFVVLRRPLAPTRGDLFCIRWAIIPIVAVGVILFSHIWERRLVN